MTGRAASGLVSFLVAAVLTATVASAQDSLARARDLYASAAYEEALATLNRLRASGVAAEDGPAVEQYRALCLLALGSAAEADAAIQAVVTAVPSYTPSEADVSPRVRSAFSEVRRRVLPSIIRQKYAEAKAAFDRKDYAAAGDGFTQVLKGLADSDLASTANQPPLADLRTLAQGFQDLSSRALAPAASPPPAPQLQPAPEPAPQPPRVYTAADTNVVAPVVVRQTLPQARRPMRQARGAVEVVIDENGAVESASFSQSIDRAYDSVALETIRKWRYKPATREGVPVKFKKTVQIAMAP